MHTWNSFFLQDSNSPNMDLLIFFHDTTIIVLILITCTISYMFFFLLMNKFYNRMMMKEHSIEFIWTIIPMFILLFIAIPSLKILYILEESPSPLITVKTIGHQWYWNYELCDYNHKDYESYMITLEKTSSLELFRLLDVDNRLILPYNTPIRILVSSTDVIHSWAVPALGIKIDASPGRINQTLLTMNRPGVFFGQCSEICGANHSFMPVTIESTNMSNYIKWMENSSTL